MSMIKTIGYASFSSLFLAVTTATSSVAETGQANALPPNASHNMVHRVIHSLADAQTYNSGGTSGYKWGDSVNNSSEAHADWASTAPARSGYKWGDTAIDQPQPSSYAGAANYQWGVRNYAGQAGYRWGVRNFADQAGYRWGVRNLADQTGYRWGVRNFADQAGYRWGVRSFADQVGYRWGVR